MKQTLQFPPLSWLGAIFQKVDIDTLDEELVSKLITAGYEKQHAWLFVDVCVVIYTANNDTLSFDESIVAEVFERWSELSVPKQTPYISLFQADEAILRTMMEAVTIGAIPDLTLDRLQELFAVELCVAEHSQSPYVSKKITTQ